MNKYAYIATLTLLGSSLAQEQNRNPSQSQPLQNQAYQNQPKADQKPALATDPSRTSADERATTKFKELLMDWRLEDLPQPVQKTVQEQSRGAKISDIDHDDRGAQPAIWEIEFEQEGRNREIRVSEDGSLLPDRDQARAFGKATDQSTARPGERPSAIGNPAGAQTGRSVNFGLGTQWEDLPAAVQQKAARYGGKEKVADIDAEEWNGRAAYEVEFRREGRNLEVLFGEDGTVLKSNDPNAAPAQPATAVDPARTPPTDSVPRTEPARQPSPNQPPKDNQLPR